jgi:ABC-type nitrate/sulfonate/bicarbonate transport system substrate-binding protein
MTARQGTIATRRVTCRVALTAMAALLTLTACGSDDGPTGTTSEEGGEVSGAVDGDGNGGGAVEPITLAHPCTYPTCWFSTPIYVADNFGFFDKYDVEVEIQPMRSGGDITQATHTADIDAGHIGSEPFIVGAPRGLNVTAIYGENNQDWILVSRDPEVQSCADVDGKTSGAQAVGDARWLVLAIILDNCGVSIDNVNTVDTSGDYLGPLVGGVLDTHVLHLDELAEVIHQTGDDWRIIERLSDVHQLHYTMYVANTAALERNRDGFVRMVAALAEAAEFMNDPDNLDDIVELLAGEVVPQTDHELVGTILQDFLAMEQWALGENGLNETYIANSIEQQAEMGNIPEAYPAGELIDTSVWDDAWQLVEANR